ncbi:MAG: biotin/lipoyl-containing protein [Candidatus Limnocylindria bacterium]|nr:biotin/lipoyl-containing protein [Candidatus Limnocylindria bacterium]
MADPRKVRPELNALVAELLGRLEASDLRELEVRRNGLRVKVSKGAGSVAALPAVTVAGGMAARPATPGTAEAVVLAMPAAATGIQVTAPLTGIFYRSPSPQAGPFVQVGGVVGAGDVVALIEAMKLFNEIRSDVSGVVRRVLAENGQLVKKHQPLFELDPV